jgi:hypothetical protein
MFKPLEDILLYKKKFKSLFFNALTPKLNLLGLTFLFLFSAGSVFSQLFYKDNQGDDISLGSLEDIENTIDSCISQFGIGSGLNYLSTIGWTLDGAGKNITDGDSLSFSFFNNGNIMYCHLFDEKTWLQVPEVPDFTMWSSKFIFLFLFTDKENYNNVLNDLKSVNYIKVSEETFPEETLLIFNKGKEYEAILGTLKNASGTTYYYKIYNINGY